MADAAALLSVRLKYVRLIADGVKRVEFRRRPFARRVAHIVLYTCAPVRRVAGWCEVEDVVTAAPETLWARYGASGGVDRDTLLRYLAGRASATAILLGAFSPAVGDCGLWELGVRRPPQSFQYLAGDWRDVLDGGRLSAGAGGR